MTPSLTADLLLALPELFLLGMACAALLADLFLGEQRRLWSYLLTQAALVGAALLVLASFSHAPTVAFDGLFVRDALGDALTLFILLLTSLSLLYSGDYLRARGLWRGEYFALALCGALGMLVLVSGRNLLTLYLGLELMSLSLYAMTALWRDSARASEAAMKYFVLGALASGMLLYGMSMLYGAAGTLDLALLAERVQGVGDDAPLLFGLVFIVVGIAFKLGAAPFHMWLPDVYSGAPTSVTLYIGTAPKIAAFALLMRLLVDGMGGLFDDWRGMAVILAILSMAVGNLAAIVQTNLKRMLAYSAIAHVGFLLVGVASGARSGYAAAMFYAVVYAITSAGGFGAILLLSRPDHEMEALDDYRGLAKRHPWHALMLMILLFSMAGIPPLAGFYAKFAVLREAAASGLLWLAVIAVLFSVVGAYYYLRVVKLLYFDDPATADESAPAPPLPAPAADVGAVLSVNALSVLALGLFPGALMALCWAVIG